MTFIKIIVQLLVNCHLDKKNNENMTKFEFENIIFPQLNEVRHEF